MSLFRQNVEVHGVSVGIDALAFEITMAARLREHGASKVYVPELVVFDAPRDDATSLRAAIQNAQEARASTWGQLAPLVAHLATLEAGLDAAVAERNQQDVDAAAAAIRDLRRILDPIIDPLSKVDQRFNQLQAQFVAADPQSDGYTLLARLFRAENLRARDPLFVHVRVVASGGINRTKHTLFTNTFIGDGLSSLGGVVVSWALLEADGSVQKGGTATHARSEPFPKLSEKRPVCLG